MEDVWPDVDCEKHLSSVFAICVKKLAINLANKMWHPLKTQDPECHSASGWGRCLVTIWRRERHNAIYIIIQICISTYSGKIQHLKLGDHVYEARNADMLTNVDIA